MVLLAALPPGGALLDHNSLDFNRNSSDFVTLQMQKAKVAQISHQLQAESMLRR